MNMRSGIGFSCVCNCLYAIPLAGIRQIPGRGMSVEVCREVLRRIGARQRERGLEPAFGAVLQGELAAVGARDVACDAQAQAGSAGFTAARRFAPEEGFEGFFELLFGDAETLVADLDDDALGAVLQT